MKLTLHKLALPLEFELRISRGRMISQKSLIVELQHNEFTGLGEVTANTYYRQTLSSLAHDIDSVRPIIETANITDPEQLWNTLSPTLKNSTFALCAIDLAAHDLFAQIQGQPLFETWGLTAANMPRSSYTIGIDSIENMICKLKSHNDWPCYKIKLGTPNDIEIVEALRAHTKANFRVDANCAWSPDEAINNSARLAELGVEFIEQPLPANATDDDKRQVFEHSVLPIIADESCLVEDDVEACDGLFHGINVKLSKCGGLTPALRMLKSARQLGMKTMVGCMVESSIGISAAAHLAPLLDYADLDGAVLLKDEPATGVRIENGEIRFSDRAGSGAILHRDRLIDFQIKSDGET